MKFPTILFAVLMLCNFLFSYSVNAQKNFYWIPTSGTNANNGANWRQDSCGGSTGAVPSSSDTIIFQSSCSNSSCTVDLNFSIAKIEVKSTYTGTISMNVNKTFTFKIGEFKGGYFTGNNGTITANGSLLIQGTNFTSTSGTLMMIGDFTYKSGSFSRNNGKVYFRRSTPTTTYITGNPVSPNTISLNKAEFAAATYNTQYSINYLAILVNDSLILSGSNQLFLYTTTGTTIEAKGTVMSSNSNNTGGGNSTIVINGSSNQTLVSTQTGGSGKLPNIKVNKTGGTLTLSGEITLGGSTQWEYTSGTVNESTATLICYYSNTLKNSSGGEMKFYNLEMQGTSGIHSVSGTVIVTNMLSATLSGECRINPVGGNGIL